LCLFIISYEVCYGFCSKQTKILNHTKKIFTDIIFLSYEQSKNEKIAKKLGIKFWTTIVVYKGDNAVTRIVSQTNKKIIYSIIKEGV
tara:strand:- start:263 stop:523 length:261 start_codon:yes stop_codon:yes gene_type:complete